jgi:two-component sensor histidine kinase
MAPQVPSDFVVPTLALALVASSATPLLLLDADQNVLAASASFCAAFQIDLAKTNGSLSKLGAGEWNVPQLASLLKTTAAGSAKIDKYEMELRRNGHDNHFLVLTATKLTYGTGDETAVALSIADITAVRAEEILKQKLLREKDVLLQELHHRVANSLQIIASVLMQSARNVQSEETRLHLKDAHQRVMSVASLQRQLASSKQGDVELRPYFTALCESIGASMIPNHKKLSLAVSVDDSITTADTSVGLGLIVTELVINALKHAFPADGAGRISVDYRSRGLDWTLSVSDDGVGMLQDAKAPKPGLGTSIVTALAQQLGGIVSVSNANPGTKISVVHTYVPVLVGHVAANVGHAI